MNCSCLPFHAFFSCGRPFALPFPSSAQIFALGGLSSAFDSGTATFHWTWRSPFADNAHSPLIWSHRGQTFGWDPGPRWAGFDWWFWWPSRAQKSFFRECLAAHICSHLPKLCFYQPKDWEWWCSWTQWFLFTFVFFLFAHPLAYRVWTIQLQTFYILGIICLLCLLQ